MSASRLVAWEEFRVVEAHFAHFEHVDWCNDHKGGQDYSARLEEKLVEDDGANVACQHLIREHPVGHQQGDDRPEETQGDEACYGEETGPVADRHEYLKVVREHVCLVCRERHSVEILCAA